MKQAKNDASKEAKMMEAKMKAARMELQSTSTSMAAASHGRMAIRNKKIAEPN